MGYNHRPVTTVTRSVSFDETLFGLMEGVKGAGIGRRDRSKIVGEALTRMFEADGLIKRAEDGTFMLTPKGKRTWTTWPGSPSSSSPRSPAR